MDKSSPVQLHTVAKQYYNCQICGTQSDSPVDHLFEDAKKYRDGKRPAGPWRCHECNADIWLNATASGELFLQYTAPQYVAGWALLKLDQATERDIFIVVDRLFGIENGEIDYEHCHYYFNEHTCPTNYLGVECIAEGGDLDPHGVFTFVRGATFPAIEHLTNRVCVPVNEKFGRGAKDHDALLEEVFPELIGVKPHYDTVQRLESFHGVTMEKYAEAISKLPAERSDW